LEYYLIYEGVISGYSSIKIEVKCKNLVIIILKYTIALILLVISLTQSNGVYQIGYMKYEMDVILSYNFLWK
jgi:hypothetical protein